MKVVNCDATGWQSLSLPDDSVALWWLGQAGFAIRYGSGSYLIDPYLSDSLAKKYKDQTFPHQRMMPPPIEPADLHRVDWIFCTHRHTDHMDPGTLLPVSRSGDCRFLVPCAELDYAIENLGLDSDHTFCINAGQSLSLGRNLELQAVPAAHESLRSNRQGEHHFLGYIFRFGDIRIYHSGDCVPYQGLEEYLMAHKPDIALLPVNGRGARRRRHNVAGNFHFEEAAQLCQHLDIAYLIPHHFGMFDFNTLDPADLGCKIKATNRGINVVLPRIDKALVFSVQP